MMPAGRITGRRDPAAAQRVALAHHADEAIAEQSLRAYLRTRAVSDDAGLQIDTAVAQRRVVLVGFCMKRSRTPGASLPTRVMRPGPKFSTKPSLVRSVNVRTNCTEVERLGRSSEPHRSSMHELADPPPKLERAWRRHEAASGPDQQRIACCLSAIAPAPGSSPRGSAAAALRPGRRCLRP